MPNPQPDASNALDKTSFREMCISLTELDAFPFSTSDVSEVRTKHQHRADRPNQSNDLKRREADSNSFNVLHLSIAGRLARNITL